MTNEKNEAAPKAPRLIKATDLAARRAAELAAIKEKSERRFDAILSAVRMRTPRDAGDARKIFESLFDTTARA